jgi:hypothetical protein
MTDTTTEQSAGTLEPCPFCALSVAQFLVDREDMDMGEFLKKYPDYPLTDVFEIFSWLTKKAREDLATLKERDK